MPFISTIIDKPYLKSHNRSINTPTLNDHGIFLKFLKLYHTDPLIAAPYLPTVVKFVRTKWVSRVHKKDTNQTCTQNHTRSQI